MRERSDPVGEPAEYDDDRSLLDEVLRCYKPHCRYLKSGTLRVDGGQVSGHGELRIPESCYIDDTGHLNAVEVNICYNQMLYYVIAKSIKERLVPAFDEWTMDDYWARRLPDILIARFQSAFARPIDPSHFFGEFRIEHVARYRPRSPGQSLIYMDTVFRCWDDAGGRCTGRVKVAIKDFGDDDGASPGVADGGRHGRVSRPV